MTTIGSIVPQASTQAASDKNKLIQDYDTFLKILTTQIQNQDPMEPMDSNQFTEQLVQFSSVEQQIQTNDQLENLANMMTNSNALGVLNFVGTTVTVDGTKGYLSEFGGVSYGFEAPQAGTAEITIRNEAGNIVFNQAGVALTEGQQNFKWDGKDNSGNRVAKGNYTIQISAEDAEGGKIAIKSDTTGVVENVDLSSSQPMLIINGQKVPTSQIKFVSTSASGTA